MNYSIYRAFGLRLSWLQSNDHANKVATLCCSVLQCVAVCCSVLQCVAVCCSVLQCVAVCCSVLHSNDRANKMAPAKMRPFPKLPIYMYIYTYVYIYIYICIYVYLTDHEKLP